MPWFAISSYYKNLHIFQEAKQYPWSTFRCIARNFLTKNEACSCLAQKHKTYFSESDVMALSVTYPIFKYTTLTNINIP